MQKKKSQLFREVCLLNIIVFILIVKNHVTMSKHELRYRGNKEVKKSPKYEMSYEDEVAALVIHKTEPDDTGVYKVQASNPLGQVKSEGNLAVHSKSPLTYARGYTKKWNNGKL